MIVISRRRFLALSGGLLATGCTATRSDGAAASSPLATSMTSTTGPTTTVPTTTPGVVTTVSTPPELASAAMIDQPVLVLVELRGGNDAVNTLPPLTGAYRDLRPTLSLAESDIVTSAALPGHGLHPSLSPLLTFIENGRMATLAGIGFDDPNRSHFVSMDRWARADRLEDSIGWLGRWLDTLPDELTSLGATSLGAVGEVTIGASEAATVIDDVTAFAFPSTLSNATVRALGEQLSDDPIVAAAQRAFVDSVGAIEEFDAIADAVRARTPKRNGSALGVQSGAYTTGLAIAAEMILGDVGTRVVTISVNGFDTHSEQLEHHAALLADLANGLAQFWATLDNAGASDRVLLATTSEFGRRVAQNASEGCDHGAAGVSFLMGNSVNGALFGALDTSGLLDGDLRPQLDPRVMFTACLDWLGGDVEQILGKRYEEIALLK
ncbi:DUF1501 domain-containing protein [uncultured Ilumatobacter sp.]|uniref:DUF1501 domain-containing protein n=1 Tax=uncultured Ilumatobacter sp. TaxID=879968 RepID=UPI00374F3358